MYDTEENKRTEYTEKTLKCLIDTVDFTKHKLRIIDNNSCSATKKLYLEILPGIKAKVGNVGFIQNQINLGTAKAINQCWKNREEKENCIKIDNDVIINSKNWIEEMEEVLERDKRIGQVGLKRKDLIESPTTEGFYKSELYMLPHEPGQKWIVTEKCNHIMGTCVMHSSRLLDKVGYLYQPTLYGFDDSIMSHRSLTAGFTNVFLPHIDIDHIDRGDTEYTKEKQKSAGKDMDTYTKILSEHKDGTRSIYYNPFE